MQRSPIFLARVATFMAALNLVTGTIRADNPPDDVPPDLQSTDESEVEPVRDPGEHVEPPPDAAREESLRELRNNPKRMAMVREELFTFAPYASMHSRFTLAETGGGSAVGVLTEWTQLRELNEGVFTSDASLRAAYQDLRAFMISTETQAKPLLQALKIPPPKVDPIEYPEMALVELMFLASAEVARNSALMNWALQHDKTCRNAYVRLMPLVRQMGETARDTRPEDSPIRVRHWFMQDRGVYLEALNESGRDLNNVTMVARWHTLDGPIVTSYYFLSSWPKAEESGNAHRYQLRVPVEWWDVGAAATTAVTLEVISDQISVKPVRFEFDDHIPTASDRIIQRGELRLAKASMPALVVREMNKIDPLLAKFPDRQQKARDIRARAQDILEKRIDAIDASIRGLEKEKAGLLGKDVPKYQKDRIPKINAQIRQLQDQRRRIVSGRE